MTERGEQIRVYLEEAEADAHLSGLDVLSGWTNQIYVAYAHLVVTSRVHAITVEFDLVNTLGLVCTLDWTQVMVPDLDNLAVIYPVESYGEQPLLALAPHQQAWLETYQALNSDVYPLQAGELGHMLLAAGEDEEPLATGEILARAPCRLHDELAALFAGEPQTDLGRRVLAGWRAEY